MLHHYPFRAGDFTITHQFGHADLESQGLQLRLWDAIPIEKRSRRDLQGRTEMVAVVEVEVEGQRQGPVFSAHRLLFEGEGRKLLAQSIKFGLIVSTFQNERVFMAQNYE